MRTINISGKEYPFIFNGMAIEDFGTRCGHDTIQQTFEEFAKIQSLASGSDMPFEAVALFARLLHCGITEGADIQGVPFELDEKALKRYLCDNPEAIMATLEAFARDTMGKQAPAKKKPAAKN